MASFIVNGQEVSPSKNHKLLRFLRDELHITSAKDGCSEGACGACTVIIDGQTCKSCVPDTDSLAGKNVITVEGLSDWEQKVYTYAYGKAGADVYKRQTYSWSSSRLSISATKATSSRNPLNVAFSSLS